MALRRGLPLALVLVLAACGGGGSKDSQGTTTATTTDANGCTTVEQPKPAARKARSRRTGSTSRRPTRSRCRRTAAASRSTSPSRPSPATTASFVSLVRKGFYDNTIFHRIVPGFIIQGGDPTASGLGGPGYSTVDKPPPTARYTLGTVAMAKTQAEPAGTSGSQFFIVTAQDAQLPPRLRDRRRGQGRARHGDADRRARRCRDRAADRDRRDPEGDRLQSSDRRGRRARRRRGDPVRRPEAGRVPPGRPRRAGRRAVGRGGRRRRRAPTSCGLHTSSRGAVRSLG